MRMVTYDEVCWNYTAWVVDLGAKYHAKTGTNLPLFQGAVRAAGREPLQGVFRVDVSSASVISVCLLPYGVIPRGFDADDTSNVFVSIHHVEAKDRLSVLKLLPLLPQALLAHFDACTKSATDLSAACAEAMNYLNLLSTTATKP